MTFKAGDTVVGQLHGVLAPATVRLVRVERAPSGDRALVVGQRQAGERFELAIPPAALPSACGAECSLSYVLQAGRGDVIARTGLEVSAATRVHLDRSLAWADRLVRNWDANHFHIELSDALLRGGGRIAGRVHRDAAWRSGAMRVVVRCSECWRSDGLPHGMPQWRASPLWEAEQQLEIDRSAAWARFAFDLPEGLPPAVEARSIAWRYEVVARRRVRHWFDETAALTPLVHEDRVRPTPLP